MTNTNFFSLLLMLCLASPQLWAQADGERFSRVRVTLDEQHRIWKLARLGIDVTHGQYAAERFFESDFSESELRMIQAAGFDTQILIADVQAHYRNPDRVEVALRGPTSGCDGITAPAPGADVPVPQNFSLGSMAGFFTYEEMLEHLDRMAELYPHLITAKAPLPGETSVEGRPIYWMRLSDNPNEDEADEPQVFLNALHHAREPNSLSQLIFFMWHLLENYDSDPEIQYLVNHSAIYFVPCINPDGYIYNQVTNPDGGGLWRKNRRLNDNGSYGVDLNRNYGYEWGHDNSGSSPNPSSQVYRGTEGFSEPETRAIRDFCNSHRFEVCLNYHTFGNLLIYPWGFSDSPSPDSYTFVSIAQEMARFNNYVYGTGSETVGYVVNGGSDDWMYGEQDTKPKIYSMTPEVGRSGAGGGFWPVASSIIPNCQAAHHTNLTALRVLHSYGVAREKSEALLASLQGTLAFDLQRMGLRPGLLTVSATALSSNIAAIGPSQSFDLGLFEVAEGGISYQLAPGTSSGEELVFLLSVSNGQYAISDTIRKRYAVGEQLFADSGDAAVSQWTGTTWGATDEDFYSAGHSITDSPYASYASNALATLTMNEEITLPSFTHAFLTFWAKWDIEAMYDYAQVQMSINDTDYIPLCGRYTVPGSVFQPTGEPVYEGQQPAWVAEEIDITEHVSPGDRIRLRFLLGSDSAVEGDGFYFDDLVVGSYDENAVSTSQPLHNRGIRYSCRPNPAGDEAYIDIASPDADLSEGYLLVYNTLGQPVTTMAVPGSGQRHLQLRLDTSHWPEGVYGYVLHLASGALPMQRLVVRRQR